MVDPCLASFLKNQQHNRNINILFFFFLKFIKVQKKVELKETFRFRPANNDITGRMIFDQYWPKKDYLRGLAYEGLGDKSNARESYLDFLRIWSDADVNLTYIIDAKKRVRNLGCYV